MRSENLYNNIDVKRSGEPLTRADVCGVDDVNCDPLLRPENVKGKCTKLNEQTNLVKFYSLFYICKLRVLSLQPKVRKSCEKKYSHLVNKM